MRKGEAHRQGQRATEARVGTAGGPTAGLGPLRWLRGEERGYARGGVEGRRPSKEQAP